SFDTHNVTTMNTMFGQSGLLETIFVSTSFVTDNLTAHGQSMMFWQCYAIKGGMGTQFTSGQIDASYAHIDGGTSAPGYFTAKP
ncbi:MAG: hypothetical protein II187_10415, partial [Treponema sp.]|nr:hypothetical protein [Treponema sp.]